MRHYIYKTTCIPSGKYYYGVHSERRISDGYIGSGVCSNGTAVSLKKKGIKSYFIDSVINYGYKNFKKEIICEFENSEDAFEVEELIVDEEEVNNKKCMNIKLGGSGGVVISKCKSVVLLDTKTGEEFSFKSQADCASFLGLKNISGKKRFIKGRYVRSEFCEPVLLKKIDGKKIKFVDILEASKETGLKVSRIRDLIRGDRNSANGYFNIDFDFNSKNWQGVKRHKKGKY